MKILLSVTSCHALRHLQDSQRDTWVADIPKGIDFRFFLGRPDTQDFNADEVFLNVDDSYEGATEKTVVRCRWALEQGYDFLYKTDTDTLVMPKALIESDFHKYDFVGGRNGAFASGGSGYWLSKRGMEIVAGIDPTKVDWHEDVAVAQALGRHGIQLHDDSRYVFFPGVPLSKNIFSYHISSAAYYDSYGLNIGKPYTPELMYRFYNAWRAL